MHLTVFWGVYPLLPAQTALRLHAPAAFIAVMVLSPVMVRVLDRFGLETAARLLAWVAYCWMGLLFLLFCMYAAAGLIGILACLSSKTLGLPELAVRSKVVSGAILAVGVSASIYGFYEARSFSVERVPIAHEKLNGVSEPIKLLQISDLHIGLINRGDFLESLALEIGKLQPDIIVATGDIVDAQILHLDGLSNILKGIEAPLGKFAVTGNHETYAGMGQSVMFLEKSGFRVLRNDSGQTGPALTIVGVDDFTAWRQPEEEAKLLESATAEGFTVYLKHRPLFNEKTAGLFDLQLSGHAHKGQIFPFEYLVATKFPMQDGLYELAKGELLYANRGTGTWGPPMRLFSPPEITLFELTGNN